MRLAILIYGVAAYLLFLGTVLYAIGFVGGFLVPKSIDSGTASSIPRAILIDVGLMALFAVQHSVMARPAFKARWTRIIPAAAERSTYVLASSLALILLYWLWQPLPQAVFVLTNEILHIIVHGISLLGWLVVLTSTFLINHFDLFGLRQVYLHFAGIPYSPVGFKAPVLHRLVRHPIMLGFMIAFWATPTMSAGHLLFAAVCTAYILVAIRLEERDLTAYHGDSYRQYQQQVRMLIPWPRQSSP